RTHAFASIFSMSSPDLAACSTRVHSVDFLPSHSRIPLFPLPSSPDALLLRARPHAHLPSELHGAGASAGRMDGGQHRWRAPLGVRGPAVLHEPTQSGEAAHARVSGEHQEAGAWERSRARELFGAVRGREPVPDARAGAPSRGIRVLAALAALRG